MSRNKKILHDISKMASAAFSGATTIKREVSSYLKENLSDFLSKMNLVRREEFEAQHKMVLENKKRLDAISGDVKKKSAKKPTKEVLVDPSKKRKSSTKSSKKTEIIKKPVKKASSHGKKADPKKASNAPKKSITSKKTSKK